MLLRGSSLAMRAGAGQFMRSSISPRVAGRFNGSIRSMSALKAVGLDDWKFQIPVGIFLAIPILHNEVLILSEETQLVGCFIMFCGAMYKYTGDAFAEMLDKRSADIQAQHNALEAEAITELKEVIQIHEKSIHALSQISAVPVMQRSLAERLAVVKHQELKHNVRDKVVKFLDDLVFKEEQVNAILSKKMLTEAAEAVTAQFQNSDIKEKALDEAIQCLAKPDEAKPTLVPDLFISFLKAKSTEATEQKGTQMTLSPQVIQSLQDEITTIIKREGFEESDIDLKVPSTVTI